MSLPWWCSPVASLIAYISIGILLPLTLPTGHPAFAAFDTMLPKLADLAALLLLIPMPFAYITGRKKQKLVDTRTDLESIRSLSWQQFEQLVAAAYRRKGYSTRENLTAGPDGGVDIWLEWGNQLHLVQCKQWRAAKVGVSVVRELYGVMSAEEAASAAIVTSGVFTQEAKNFAEGKSIDLIDGAQLLVFVQNVQTPRPVKASKSFSHKNICPKCSNELVKRTAKRGRNTGKQFLGCCTFPKCHYTRDL